MEDNEAGKNPGGGGGPRGAGFSVSTSVVSPRPLTVSRGTGHAALHFTAAGKLS